MPQVKFNMWKDQNRVFVFGAGIFIVGFGLRVFRLLHQSFWNDEVITFNISRLNFWEIAVNPINSNFPPLYYGIIHTLFGFDNQELFMRLPSVILGTLSILLFYFLVRNWFGQTTGFIGAIMMAISPFHIWYSQEARPYALLLFLALLSIWLLQLVIKNPKSLWLKILFIFVTVSTFYTHYLALAFIGFICIYIYLSFPEQSLRYKLFLCGAILLLVAPGMVLSYLNNPTDSANSYYVFNPGAIGYLIWSFVTGYSLGPTIDDLHAPDKMNAVLPYIGMIVPTVALFMILTFRGLFRLWKTDRLKTVLIGSWFLFPLLFAILGAILTSHPFNVRYAILSFPAFYALLALALIHLIKKMLRLQWSQSLLLLIQLHCLTIFSTRSINARMSGQQVNIWKIIISKMTK